MAAQVCTQRIAYDWKRSEAAVSASDWTNMVSDYRIVRSEGDVRWIDARCFVSYDGDGRPKRVIGVNIDVTERKRAEDQQRVLVAELDHRVKNVLATVSAIVTQTQDAGSSPADFVAALDSRIKSLARTHELLSQSRWSGVSLAEIARREFAPYAADNVEIGGPSVTLKAEAAQAMAMVLHELTTNAAKYGAFSDRNGRVSLRWRWLRNGSTWSAGHRMARDRRSSSASSTPIRLWDRHNSRTHSVRARRYGGARLCRATASDVGWKSLLSGSVAPLR